MSALTIPLITNHLLQLLSDNDRHSLLQYCDLVQLTFAEILFEPKHRYRYLYFPLSGFISLVSRLADHKPLEMGLIGSEGMLGVTLALDINTAQMQAVVLGEGSAWRVELADLQHFLRFCPHFRHILQQYLFVQLSQLSQSAACAHFHELNPRLARWLLMCHDCAHSNQFYLTHQFLSDMLGVRRSGITVAAGIFQKQQFISYNRGIISILDRQALKHLACECYQAGLDDYRSVLGEPDNPIRSDCAQVTP